MAGVGGVRRWGRAFSSRPAAVDVVEEHIPALDVAPGVRPRALIAKKISLVEELERELDDTSARHGLLSLSDSEQRHAHQENLQTVEAVRAHLEKHGFEARIIENVTPADAAWAHLVVSVGGDGTFMRASHAVVGDARDTLIVGVNSSPASSFGYFCAGTRDNFAELLDSIVRNEHEVTYLNRMTIAVNGEDHPVPALNDALFASDTPVTTVRYALTYRGTSQLQKSSGVWISTAAGSTAAIRSAGGEVMPLHDSRLQFRVRELFMSSIVGEPIASGFVEKESDFAIESRLPRGRIYLDGHNTFLEVAFGDVLTFRADESPLKWIRPQADASFWAPERWQGQWQRS